MKNFTVNRHSSAFKYCAVIAVSLFLFSSCPEPESKFFKGNFSGEQGSFSIFIDEASPRTILPSNSDWSNFAGTFEISITETDSGVSQPSVTRNLGNLSDPIQLDAGTYTVTVTAFIGSNPVARGSINITVNAGTPAAHIIRLRAISDAGTGTFSWNIAIPAVDSGSMQITHIDGVPAAAEVVLTQGANSGTANLNSGYYYVVTVLTRSDHARIMRRDVLHVYQNMTSVFTVEFPDAMFNSNLHNVIFDHGYGSLSESIPVIHGEKAVRPANPARTGHIFMDWYSDAAFTNKYDFDTLVSAGITLYARWGTVIVTINDVSAIYADLTAAFNAIGTQEGNFTVTVYSDQTMTGARTINTAGQYVTITGEGGMRTITHGISSLTTNMFTVSSSNASLTLGNNITIQGRTAAGAGAAVNITNGTFRMRSGSRITGHTSNAGNGGTVQINGAAAIFNMDGGAIEGNNNTSGGAATSTGSGGVSFTSGYFTMLGGSITGNRHGTAAEVSAGTAEESDVYAFTTGGHGFTVSGNANIGALKLNATSASFTTVGTTEWTGSIGKLNLRGNDADIATAAGWWNNKQIFTNITAAQVDRVGLGDFISSDNTRQPINNTHYISASGVLTAIPASVTVNNGTTTTNHIDIDAAFDAIGTQAGNFIVTLYRDQTMTVRRTITTTGQNITMVGEGARIIDNNDLAGDMFNINNATASLTLGNNVTIKGRGTTTVNGSVVWISTGTFRMLEGSRITRHRNAVTSNAAVTIGIMSSASSRFEMSGGSIDGCLNPNSNVTETSGGVNIHTGTFIMSGGSITGNTHSVANYAPASDVYIGSTAANSFTISGSAEIGVLRLGATETANVSVTIGAGGWSGSIGKLNLRGNIAAFDTAASYWNNRQIFNGITASEAALINNIILGDFFGIVTSDGWAAISPAFYIGTAGADLGRLIMDNDAAPVTVTSNSTTTYHFSLGAAFDAIGTQAGNFTITLREDQAMTAQRAINTANQHITIIGEGAERTITHGITASGTAMFTISIENASLTIGNNVTIRGRTTAANGDLIFISIGTFRMLEGSRLTGHRASSAAAAAVYIGSVGRFEMSGGSIDGNINTTAATNTAVSGGVNVNNGTFIMTGGSITGNTQGADAASGEASDVYIDTSAADRSAISGNAAIGALKLNATAAAHASVTIGAGGWSGSIGKLNLRGNIAAVDTAVGYWNNKQVFNSITTAQVSQIGLGEFISSGTARRAIANTHFIGTSGANLGRLMSYVTVSTNGGAEANYDTLADAYSAIGTQAGNFTITLYRDQTMTALRNINTTDQNITIVGSGAMRTITHGITAAGTHMFTINNPLASLTLGNNITIHGRTTAGAGAVINNPSGTFRMFAGSRITGHTSSSGTAGVVTINGGIFEMSGGSIEGNNNTSAATNTSASGGLHINLGTFTMSGGSITGNTHSGEASDVYALTTADRFTMSGNASIGALKLSRAESGTTNVNIGAAGWTGSITRLNLRANASLAMAVDYWLNRIIFNNINSTQVARIGLGDFISSSNERHVISPSCRIGNAAPDLGRLLVANIAVTVSNGTTTTNHFSFALALGAIGTTAGNYTITLLQNQVFGAETVNIGANQNITITGSGAVRTISHNPLMTDDSMMFVLSGEGASLALGNNITIQGRTTPGAGSVVWINYGTFRMQTGSRITGHQMNSQGNNRAAVTIGRETSANAVFEMSGGEITGNNSSAGYISSGGVYLGHGTFTMTGGSITGNTRGTEASDVFRHAAGQNDSPIGSFTLSGNANIGTLVLYWNSGTAIATVNTAAGWTGNITTLNLGAGVSSISSTNEIVMIIDRYQNRILFNGITNAQVARIGLGVFTNGPRSWNISDTHLIGTTGTDLGRLIRRVYNVGDTGPAGGIIIYRNLSGFTVQGYETGGTGHFSSYTAYYLEAAPTNETSAQWGALNTSISGITTTSTSNFNNIGAGRRDTQIIANRLTELGETGRAAQVCASKTVTVGVTVYDDWFLPSLGELNEMYKARAHLGATATSYLTSSQITNNTEYVFIQWFNSGENAQGARNSNFPFRAVRAF